MVLLDRNVAAQELRSFVRAWAMHHNFWLAQRQPKFVYRYEDLVDDPIGVLETMLRYCGLWQYYSLNGMLRRWGMGRCPHVFM
jgi:hypothetical protein